MSLYEDWMKKAFSQEGRSIEAVWEEYLPKEQKIYEYILGEKVTKLEGTIAELAARFDMTAEMIVAFIDGLNASLEEQFDMETLAEDTKVCINIDFEKLYKLMIEYKAEHLSNLPQWDSRNQKAFCTGTEEIQNHREGRKNRSQRSLPLRFR